MSRRIVGYRIPLDKPLDEVFQEDLIPVLAGGKDAFPLRAPPGRLVTARRKKKRKAQRRARRRARK